MRRLQLFDGAGNMDAAPFRIRAETTAVTPPQGDLYLARLVKLVPSEVGAVLVSMVSFVLWVYATDGRFLSYELPASPPGLISVAIGVWTFLIPLFYKGD
jgi:hypothetical protein